MEGGNGPEVVTQKHGEVHPSKGVDAGGHASHAERAEYPAGAIAIAAADQDRRIGDGPVGIAEGDHIHSFRAQESRRQPRQPGATGGVQDLHDDAFFGRWNRPGEPGRRRAGRRNGRGRRAAGKQDGGDGSRRDQRGGGEAATRLFQRRTVGSRSGQPVRIVCAMRARVTSRRTPRESDGKRYTSAARCSASQGRPGSR